MLPDPEAFGLRACPNARSFAMAEKSDIITIERAALLPALTMAQKAVARRSTIPIMANLLATVEGGRLALTGSDLDVEISATAPCAGAKTATFTLPAQILFDAVRKLPDGAEVAITVDAQNARVSAGRSRFTVPVLPAGDFPRINTGELPSTFELSPADLARMLDTTRYAISSEETRYYLNGIYLHAAEKGLTAVATDGHRLAMFAMHMPDGGAGMAGIIVPKRTVDLLKDFAAEKGKLQVSVSQSKIRFMLLNEDGGERLVMTSKLIDGTFPDYTRVVPARHPNSFTIAREALARSIDRVVTISAGAKGSSVKFGFATDALKLSANNPDLGSAEDEVSVEAGEGEAVEIGFNGRYCLDMLNATAAERVTFYIGDAGAPARVEPEGDEAATFVIMPMRVYGDA